VKIRENNFLNNENAAFFFEACYIYYSGYGCFYIRFKLNVGTPLCFIFSLFGWIFSPPFRFKPGGTRPAYFPFSTSFDTPLFSY
jgi:hypothetical protein